MIRVFPRLHDFFQFLIKRLSSRLLELRLLLLLLLLRWGEK